MTRRRCRHRSSLSLGYHRHGVPNADTLPPTRPRAVSTTGGVGRGGVRIGGSARARGGGDDRASGRRPRPEQCDWLSYLRFRDPAGPTDSADATAW